MTERAAAVADAGGIINLKQPDVPCPWLGPAELWCGAGVCCALVQAGGLWPLDMKFWMRLPAVGWS